MTQDIAMSSDEDWSDSDSEAENEQRGEVPTSVLLGVPDGPLNSAYDDADPTVSRAGGHPPFLGLSHYPSPEVTLCKQCNNPMNMLVSVFCPFEGSSNDRVLYVWACSRAGCQRKSGSVRAYRSLRYNSKYARQLERQQARQASSGTTVDKPKPNAIANPFSSPTTVSEHVSGTGGLGDILFGTAASPEDSSTRDSQPESEAWTDDVNEDDDDDDEEKSEDNQSSVTGATAPPACAEGQPDPAWLSQPAYRAFYISTVDEYIAPKPSISVSKQAFSEARPTDGAGGATWGKELYEVMQKVDNTFESFVARVQEEAEQVLRYELSGTPLSFSSRDAVYRQLFPIQAISPGTAFAVNAPLAPTKHAYEPSAIEPCPRCGGPRVFECQVMPNLINLLRPAESSSSKKRPTLEERQAELDALLKGGSDGMEWGTIMIFSCLADCCQNVDRTPSSELWAEELVLVQWDA
ncbi:hypothetical protein DACRYDRAFT_120009 [Dacryopinax primogenitus]|uniref:Programmed cell death protein 2 C-terminal domain-containing protein n=1 Tax=Dacryopinax primogenitus (strain DJM 731) TaxID=1858805 RepID=M5FNV1_DACPD|nr:uncharacterized protein DACRYDRAFT_120009 [Dacryopinax primogenitus]EJT96578.1 hypothetical protein DACRYDRAFT_120009 [Dacryopinax primogenitus]